MKYPRRHRTHEEVLQPRYTSYSAYLKIYDCSFETFLMNFPKYQNIPIDDTNFYGDWLNSNAQYKFDPNMTPRRAGTLYRQDYNSLPRHTREQVLATAHTMTRYIPFLSPWYWSLRTVSEYPDGMMPDMPTSSEKMWVRHVPAGGWYWKPVPISSICRNQPTWNKSDQFMDDSYGYTMYRLEHMSGVATDIYCNFIGYCKEHVKGKHSKYCGSVMNVFIPPKYGLKGRGTQDYNKGDYFVEIDGCGIEFEGSVLPELIKDPFNPFTSNTWRAKTMNVVSTGSLSNKIVDLYDFENTVKDSLTAVFDSAYKSNLSTKGVKTNGSSSVHKADSLHPAGPKMNGYNIYGIKHGFLDWSWSFPDYDTPYPYQTKYVSGVGATVRDHALYFTYSNDCTNYPLDCTLIAPDYAKDRIRCNDNYIAYLSRGGFVIDYREPVVVQTRSLKDNAGRVINVLPFSLGDNIYCYLADETLVFTQASSAAVVNVAVMWDKDRAEQLLVITSKKKTVTIRRYVSNDISIEVLNFQNNQYDIIKRDLNSYDVSFK